jgi:branched-chain amino acid transport system substrate-binding protein
VNKAFREAYKAQFQKEPPQFSAQAFTGVQVFVEALKKVDAKAKVAQQPLAQVRSALNQEVLAGQYETPLGKLAFDAKGEVKQEQFYVAQIKMAADGNSGQFAFLK